MLRRLVLHSSAYALSAAGKQVQLRIAALAREGRWRDAWEALLGFVMQARAYAGPLSKFGALLLSIKTPRDCNDLVVTIEAEDAFDFRDRLAQITAPTLVAAGELDPFYSAELFRETATGIPNAQLVALPWPGTSGWRKGLPARRPGVPARRAVTLLEGGTVAGNIVLVAVERGAPVKGRG